MENKYSGRSVCLTRTFLYAVYVQGHSKEKSVQFICEETLELGMLFARNMLIQYQGQNMCSGPEYIFAVQNLWMQSNINARQYVWSPRSEPEYVCSPVLGPNLYEVQDQG